MINRLTVNLEGDVRYDTLEGEDYVIVNGVMLTEGVHEGSDGRGYYPRDENKKSVQAWNHMPIVVYHPEDADGQPVSARQPAVINNRKIGLVLNAKDEGGGKKIKFEAWLNIAKTKKVDQRILDNVKAKKKTELSTGLALTQDKTPGKWNDEEYDWVAKDYKPDHLAVLPDKRGACSIADGAGLLANAAREAGPEAVEVFNKCASIGHVEYALPSIMKIKEIVNNLSFSDIQVLLRKALAGKFGKPGEWWDGWVTDVFPDAVVFYDDGTLQQIGYTSKDSNVTLVGDSVEVVRTTDYKPVKNESGAKEESTMAFDKKAHLDALVANGVIDEKSRPEFEKMDEKVLSFMKVPPKPEPAKEVQNKKEDDPNIVTNANLPAATAAATQKPKTDAEYIAEAPAGVRAMLNRVMKKENSLKEDLIKKITANQNCQFSKEWLLNQDTDFLERMFLLSGQAEETPVNNGSNYGPPLNNYSGAGGYYRPPTTNDDPEAEEPLDVPQLTINKKK